MQEFLSLSPTLVCLFLRSRSAKTFASLVTRERVENCSSIKLLVTRYGERLRFDDDIVFLRLFSRATNNFSRKLWRLANIIERSRVTLPNIYIIEPMQIIYAKSKFTRESCSFFFSFFEPYRFKGNKWREFSRPSGDKTEVRNYFTSRLPTEGVSFPCGSHETLINRRREWPSFRDNCLFHYVHCKSRQKEWDSFHGEYIVRNKIGSFN